MAVDQEAGTVVYYQFCIDDSGSPVSTATSNNSAITVTEPLSASASPTPTDLSVGQTQTLTAVPSGGTPGYTHQWQESSSPTSGFTDIPGETGLTLDVEGI